VILYVLTQRKLNGEVSNNLVTDILSEFTECTTLLPDCVMLEMNIIMWVYCKKGKKS